VQDLQAGDRAQGAGEAEGEGQVKYALTANIALWGFIFGVSLYVLP
jgi:hypothetical protein